VKILTACLAAALIAAAPATATPNPYTPRQVCGSSYQVIDSQKIADPYETMGRTYLLYSASTGRNCALTLKRDIVGAPTWTGVVLQRKGGPRRHDEGNFSYYAGPVYVTAPHTCVMWGGGMQVGVHSAGFKSGWEHCG
jgi:hypothetical protein